MSELAYQIVSGIAVVVSVASICSSVYILLSWRKIKEMKQNDLLHDYVAYMSIFDLSNTLIKLIYFSNPLFEWTFMSMASALVCKIMGILLQLSGICMTTWNFIISAFILLPIISGQSMFRIIKCKHFHFMFLLIMTCICVVMPVINDGYGLTDNIATHYGLSKYECWIKNTSDFVYFYIPVAFYVIFSIGLTIWSILCKFKNDESLLPLKSQLIWYTAIFIVIWVPPIINRFYSFFTDKTSLILTCISNISIQCVGCANVIVWYHYMQTSDIKESNEQSMTRSLVTDRLRSVQLEQ